MADIRKENFSYEAAKLVVRCLEEERCDYVFGVPSAENLPMVLALEENEHGKVKFVVTHHEQSAAMMAGIYGKLMDNPSVCLVSAGPGAASAYAGIADAHFNKCPLIVLTGGVMRKIKTKNARAYPTPTELFKDISLWSTEVPSAKSIPELMRASFKWTKAMRHAMHLEMPLDVLVERRDMRGISPLKCHDAFPMAPSYEALDRAWGLLRNAERPVILVGSGGVFKGIDRALGEFVEASKMGVYTTPAAKGVIRMDHPCNMFTVGLSPKEFNMNPLLHADLVITVGYNSMEYPPSLWNGERSDRSIIHIGMVPSYVDKQYNPTVEVIGRPDMVFDRLREKMKQENKSFDMGHIKEHRDRMLNEFNSCKEDDSRDRLKPQKVLFELRKVMRDRDILVTDAGAHKIWVDSYYHTNEINTVLSPSVYGASGMGIPAAIGAKLARRDSRIVVVVGDGSLATSLAELETARRMGLKMAIMVWEDDSFGLSQWKQQMYFGKVSRHSTKFMNPDVAKIAESYGMRHCRIHESSKLYDTLNGCISSEDPCIISIPIDYRENMKLTERLGGRIFFAI